MLDACAVVPTAIEENELFCCGKLSDITLEVPAASFSIGGLSESDNSRLARTQVLDDTLDATILPSGIAAFDENQNLVATTDEVSLQFDQFYLEQVQLRL